ncbi:MAG: carbohydrate ABC transporter permease [Trueperaceae bacterium]
MKPLHWLGFAVIAFLVLFPIYWGVRTSFAEARDASWLPRITFEHYRYLLSQEIFYRYTRNSLVVSLGTVAAVLLIGLPAAYALAKLRFSGRRFGILFLLLPLLPAIAVLTPLISYMYRLDLLNTLSGLVVLNLVFNLPFAVWMTRGFMLAVPDAVEEAAMIDGASRLGVMARITIPLTATGLFAVAAFVFVQTWNNYLYAYAIISSPDQRVIPMGILASLGAWGTQWGPLMSFGTLGVLPPILLLLVFRRWFIAGMLGQVR